MDPLFTAQLQQTRRQFFGHTGLRLGGIALATMLGENMTASAAPTASGRVHPPLPGVPHFPPKAKSIIYLHMNGGPSQLDTWDYKPQLQEHFNKDLPDSIRMGQRITTMTSKQARLPVAPTKFKFEQCGKCGTWANTELMPFTSKMVDDLAIIKTVHTNAINHDPACTFVMTGREIPGFASIGSWLAYGLGSENNDLPGFVVLTPQFPHNSNGQALFSRMWGSGFLPSKYSGVTLRNAGDPVLYLPNPDGISTQQRRTMLDALNELNQRRARLIGDPEIETRISQYEMAFRMQRSVPELSDISSEPQSVLDLYGPDVTKNGSFANSALLARRLVERGVRAVQLLHRGWDQHNDLPRQLTNQCRDTDQGTAALIQDLKNHGLLDSTLVVWGGEFGRTVYSQGKLTKDDYGRDHHPRCFSMWMAGGGIKGGQVFGETDDFSYNIVQAPVHLNELNATILRLMGIDNEQLTYKFAGLNARLTGVEGAKPVKGLML
jgi:hypothetical protein